MATVFDLAFDWAESSFPSLTPNTPETDDLFEKCKQLLRDYPGISTKKWLFIYSPTSLSPLFEVRPDFAAMGMSAAKLHRISIAGGMIFGADFSKYRGTPNCKGRFIPLVVVKP
jgi:hypothetical protein